jgi:hypothetical protein
MPELKASNSLLEELREELSRYDLNDPIIISRQTLLVALQGFLAADVRKDDLVDWANQIELHDEVQYEPRFNDVISDALFSISSPEINGSITSELCERLIVKLAESSSQK